MGGEEDVVIPIRMEVESSDISGVKSEIQKILAEYDKMNAHIEAKDKSRGKQSSANLRTNIEYQIVEVQRLSEEITKLYSQISGNNSALVNLDNLKEDEAALKRITDMRKNTYQEIQDLNLKQHNLEKSSLAAQKELEKITANRNKYSQTEFNIAKKVAANKAEELAQNTELLESKKAQYKEEQRLEAAAQKNVEYLRQVNQTEASRAAEEAKLRSENEAITDSIEAHRDRIGRMVQDINRIVLGTAETDKHIKAGVESYIQQRDAVEKTEDAIGSVTARQQRINDLVKQGQSAIKQTVSNLYEELTPEERRKALIADNERLKQEELNISAQLREAERQLAELQAERLQNGENEKSEQEEVLGIVKNRLKTELDINKAEQARNNAIIQSIPDEEADRQKNIADIKQQTSNFYYLLRSVKMVSEQFKRMSDNANKMFKSIILWGGKVLKLFGRLSLGALNLAKAFRKTKKSSDNFGGSLKLGFKRLLSYTFGIRSIYMLFRKLRGALSDGMEALAKQFPYVNKQMSSLLSSVVTMKNATATAVQPLLKLLVPALEAVSNAAIKASYNIASFFATLTGQTFVYKAIRANEDYAASLDKSTKKAKDAKKELSGLDKLNVLHSKDDGSGGQAAKVAEVAVTASKVAKQVKKIFKDLFKPIKKAWKTEGKFVMESWQKALQNCKKLIRDIGRDFLDVWKNDTGVRIWKNILHIVGDVGLVVAGLAEQFDKAWNAVGRGKKILERLQTLIDIVIQGIRDAADETVIWAESLRFGYLFRSIEKWLESLEQPVQTITDILVDFWKNVVLPFQKYLIENGLPALFKLLKKINNAIDWDGIKTKILEFNQALEPFLEKFWQALLIILDDIGMALADFVNSDAFDGFIDKLIEWMNKADPETMATGIEQLVVALATVVVVMKAMAGITAGLVNLGQVLNVVNQFRLFKATGGMTKIVKGLGMIKTAITSIPGIAVKGFTKFDGIVTKFTDKAGSKLLWFVKHPVKSFKSAFAKLPGAVNTGMTNMATSVETTIAGLETTVANGMTNIQTALAGFNPLTGVLLIVVGLITAFTAFFDMTANGFSALKEAIMLVGIALVTVGAIILGAPAAIAIAIGAAVALLLTAIVLYRDGFFEKMAEFKVKVMEGIHNFGKNVGRILGTIASKIVNGVRDFGKNTIVNIKKTFAGKSLKDIGIMIVKGVLWIFTAPARLLKLILEAVWNFFTGIVEGFNETFEISSPAKTMEPIGINIIRGVFAGILSVVSGIGKWIKSEIFDPFKKELKDAFGIVSGKAKELLAEGRSIMEGVKSGAKEKWESVKKWFSGKWDTLKSDATAAVDKFKEIGGNIIDGLKEGAGTAMEKSKSWWDNLWGTPANTAEEVNKIASPSKVFEQIGKFMTEGLYKGVTEDTDEVTDAFKNLTPSLDTMNEFYKKVVAIFKKMNIQTVEIVTDMVSQITTLIDKLNSIEISDKIAKSLSNIEVPKIAAGFTLPTNVSMQLAKSNDDKQQVDLSRLPDMLKDAFIEAILATEDTRKQGEDIVVQVSGKEIFRVVQDENNRYKKRHGGQAALG